MIRPLLKAMACTPKLTDVNPNVRLNYAIQCKILMSNRSG
jgi:hypothetical protein